MEIETDCLIPQAVVLRQLKAEGLVDVQKATFSKAVRVGNIPHQKVDGIDKRMYDYEAVVFAIKSGNYFGYNKNLKVNRKSPKKVEEEQLESIETLRARLKEEPILVDANTLKAVIQSDRDQLKLDEEKGLVIARAEVEDKAFVVARSIRNKLLTLPERIANELAVVSDAHTIKEMLYAEFELVLTGLSKDSFI